jgi:hypothetical protein
MNLDTGLLIAAVGILVAVYFWTRSHRPILTVAVKTHPGQEEGPIRYDLVILNSGTVPANNLSITVDDIALNAAFGLGATEYLKRDIFAVFGKTIPSVQNGERLVVGPFGYTNGMAAGFWKYNAIIPIAIRYNFKGLFGWWPHKQEQTIQIVDSETVTGYSWG